MNSKKLLFFFSLLCFSLTSRAQTYGNEWINYNQTYFKFGVHRDDFYRINIAQLYAMGLPASVQGSALQLFRDGAEVPMFVSNSGVMSSADYIEFYGEKANGLVDAPLYKNPNWQLNPNHNLITDTAYYFLTVNTTSAHLRFTERANNLGSPPIKEAFFWDKIKANYRGDFAAGPSYYYATTPIIYLCSSQYEEGEGYSKKMTSNNDSVVYNCVFPYKIPGAPNAYFKTTVVGYSYITSHRVQIAANNILMADSSFSAFGYKRYNISVPMSYLTPANRLAFKYTPMNNNVSANIYDRYGIASTELRYPREFNFNNVDSFYFELDPKLSDYYLEIANFNHGGVAPRLYDLSSQEFIIGDISVSGLTRFLIPASSSVKRLFLHSNAPSAAFGTVTNLKPAVFKNYTQSALQGDYIILSHARLFDNGAGINYVNEYKNYRASSAGGSYTPVVVDVQDIYDEFGYGYTYHPQSIKNFLHFAHTNAAWTNKPKFVFIIGKGIDYRNYLTYSNASSSTYPYAVVPSYGEPCSDNLFTDFNFSSKPQIPIGRLPVWYGSDVKIYLDKIIDHEASVANTSYQISDSVLWKKNVLHIAGAKKAEEQAPIVASLLGHEERIKGSFFGANVTNLRKSTTSTVETANSAVVDQLFNNGLSLVQFFGHASASTLDYNLDNPELFKNYRRYPMFIANGCGVGNVFILGVGERTLGEKFVLSPNGGSITFIASDNTGLSNKLGQYTDSLYKHFSTYSYGLPIGEQMKNTINGLTLTTDGLLRQHAEQIILNGDPATAMHSFSKPDFAVEEKGVSFRQLNITTSLDSFDVDIVLYNLGKSTGDSVSVFVKHILPNGIENIITNIFHKGLTATDTLSIRIPVDGDAAIGDNALEIILDQEGFIDELSESNNRIRRVFNIYNDDLVPVYPYEFGIVGVQGVTLKASTLNPFAPQRTYLMQIDTTELFNSPLFVSTNITSTGGVIKWQPPLTLRDSTVYYWRTAADTNATNPKHKWTNSSFIYLDGNLPGWNQSHYFQFKKDTYTDMFLDSASRKFNFVGTNKKLLVQNVCLYGPSPFTYKWPDYRVKINGYKLYDDGCDLWPGYSSLQFIVIDTITGEPWRNEVVGTEGRFGSYKPCRDLPALKDPFFEFNFSTPLWRKRVMDFIDSIPNGYYVMMQPRLCVGSTCAPLNRWYVNDMKTDTITLGSGNSLYHKLYGMGLTLIDSFTRNRPMAFFFKKGVPSSVEQVMELDSTKVLLHEFQYTSTLFEGSMASAKIGPAKKWDNVLRRGTSLDATPGDTTGVEIYGIRFDNTESFLGTAKGDTSLANLNATEFPYIRLVLRNRDNVHTTPEQLRYWRVLYELVPEAALNPNRHFVFNDSVGQGQVSRFEVAIENLTELPLDSMLVQYQVIDKSKNKNLVASKRYFPIPVYDTIHAVIDIPSRNYPGQNLLFIEANPNNDQLEQFHPNNIGYKDWYVAPDKQNPLIDVTFDGVHIMDKDIVSSRPFINIILRDENKYLALDDTSLVGVYMKYPGDDPTAERYIPFDGTILKFIPADLGDPKNKNVARIEYRPTFLVDGNDYILTVKGKDKSGNQSGNNAYKVGFEIVNKPAISSVINYPNPFTTSTQFIFTITGAEIPSQLKIQIIAPSGKVVKEILKSDLGPLHIGTNMTEYKWRGDDQYGQPLANGVYLYRVVANLNGQQMDHYKRSATQNADKWIEKGYGKLYIMR